MALVIFFVYTIGFLTLSGTLAHVQGFGLYSSDATEGDVTNADTVEKSVYSNTKGLKSPSTDFSKMNFNINLENLLVANLKDQLSSDFGQEFKEELKQRLVKALILELVSEIKDYLKNDRFDLNTFIGDAGKTKEEIKGYLKRAVVAEVLEDAKNATEAEAYKDSNVHGNKRSPLNEYNSQYKDTIYRPENKYEESTSAKTHNHRDTVYTSKFWNKKRNSIQNRTALQGGSEKITPRVIRQSENRFAFTAYLNARIDNMAVLQTVKFNRVMLNDGNAYNTHTGVFTVPVDGVYLFSLHVDGYWRRTELRIVVDDVNEVDTDMVHVKNGVYSIQTGNLGIIRVHKGQSVWVETFHTDDGQIEGSDSLRETIFAGCLLYAD